MSEIAESLLGGDLTKAVGLNYHLSSTKTSLEHWVRYDDVLAEEQIAFLAANGVNTVRTFLNFDVYEMDPPAFEEALRHFAFRMAMHRIVFIPVLFDSFGGEPSGDPLVDADSPGWIQNPATATLSEPDFPARAGAYIGAVVDTVNQAVADAGEPGVWWIADLWNEPHGATVPVSLLAQLLDRIRMQVNPPATTVGFADFEKNEELLAELADHEALTILSGHPYGTFAEVVTQKVAAARTIGDAYGGKEVFVSELGLPGLFQYYPNCLQWLEAAGVGFALWEAFIGLDQFKNLQGLFYPEPIVDGQVTVRSATAVNALWAAVRRHDSGFASPCVAREKPLELGYESLGPAEVTLSTGAYHRLLSDHVTYYGTAEFPQLSLDAPHTRALYVGLMRWTYLSFGKILTVDGPTQTFARMNLTALREQYDLGNLVQAETALINLFELAAQLMADHGLGEPTNYPPEVLHMALTTTLNVDGTTFDAYLETAVFDVDQDALSVWLFARDVETGEVSEIPLVGIPDTTAFVADVPGVPLTGGREIELAVFVVDHRGGKDLYVLPATLP